MRRLLLGILLTTSACGDSDDDDGDTVGASCNDPGGCFPLVDDAERPADVICLDRVEGGYCTHLCQTDADCCAAQGLCHSDRPQVCSPFESTGMMMCFLSCENEDLDGHDEETYCSDFAHEEFICRSSGGGSANRKVCVPNGD